MKASYISIFLCILINSIPSVRAAAPSYPFDGVWIGDGETLENDTKQRCELIQFTIQQTESHLLFVEEERICENNAHTRFNIDFEVQGNELWIDHKKVGAFNKTEFFTEFFFDILEQTPKYFIQFTGYGRVEEGRFRYSEVIHYRLNGESGKSAITAEMRLKSQIK